MTTLSEQKTVGEIAAEMPASVRVFDKYRIDYCCGGKFSLSDACRGRGIPPEEVLAELEKVAAGDRQGPRDWSSASLEELIDHIVSTHHEYLKTELPRLEYMLDKVLAAHGPNHGDSLVPLSRTFAALKDELESHMAKEEMILFPMIKAGHGGVGSPIRVMIQEHDNAGQGLAAMRQVTGSYAAPADACATYRAVFHGLEALEADLHQHIHLENNILFPRAVRMA